MLIDPKQWPILSKLLDEALDVSPEDRDRWLESLPPETAGYKENLRSLLRHAGTAETREFLDVFPNLHEAVADAHAATHGAMLTPGTAVGPYVVEQQIGSGGMGAVWLARRRDGVIKRPVALKLPHAGPLSCQLADRFASERNILAELSHPNIARLYDAGFSADGQPYLALEYVAGEPLTAYCDEHRLDLRERLRLFQQVLGAVQYAHSNLVIHRDLKPSNVIVGHDGRAMLLDFGIAKLIAAESADHNPRTQVGALAPAMTLEYASPEQISGPQITTASDIYSLGVLLFELLTGGCPYRLGRTTRAALEEAVLTVGPVRPSQSVMTETAASSRGLTVRGLSKALRGDLDTIALKAMKKSPGDRYPTADALSEDIERYLAGEPIAARKDRGWYHTRKFISRHRIAAVAAGVALAAVLATAAIAVSEERSAAIHARAAAAERDRALALSARNAAVGEFLHILITEAARSNKPVAVGDLVTRSETIVNKEYRDSPEDRAAVLDVLSGYYDTREQYSRAEELLRQALEIVNTSTDADLRRKLKCSHAATLAKVGQAPEAIRVLNSVLADPQITVEQSARCLISLSRIAQANGDGPNALKFGQLALQRLHQGASHPPVALEADFLADIANAEYLNFHNDVAGQFYAQSLGKLTRAGLGRALDTLALRNNWSLVSWGAGNPRAALDLLDQTLRLAGESEPDVPPAPTWLSNRAGLLEDLGRYRESRETYLRCAAESRRTGVPEKTAICFVGLASVSHELADPVSADSYLAAASANIDPSAPPDSTALIRLRTVKGSIALTAGRIEEARAELDAVIAASKNVYRTMRALLIRAELNLNDGRVADAEEDARRVLGLARTAQGSAPYSNGTGLSWLMLGRVLRRQGDQVGARKAFQAAVENLSNTVDADHPKLLFARQLAQGGP
jgi:tetratricopeptide (TPR) repeat protein